MPKMTDPAHLLRAAPAERAGLAFDEFFAAEKTRLYRALCLVTRNRHEAEELTQDAFVRVLERWDRVERMDDPAAYLYRTAMNTFRSASRRAEVMAKRAIGILPSDDGMAEIDAADAAMRALAQLSTRQRAAIVLVDLLGYPSDEAASILGLRAGTVRTHLARAHASLKETIER
jgi:RNA polymerase sigma factor (sigma-70 family)